MIYFLMVGAVALFADSGFRCQGVGLIGTKAGKGLGDVFGGGLEGGLSRSASVDTIYRIFIGFDDLVV